MLDLDVEHIVVCGGFVPASRADSAGTVPYALDPVEGDGVTLGASGLPRGG